MLLFMPPKPPIPLFWFCPNPPYTVVIIKVANKDDSSNTYLVVHSSLLIHVSKSKATACIRTSSKPIVRAHSLIALIVEPKLFVN